MAASNSWSFQTVVIYTCFSSLIFVTILIPFSSSSTTDSNQTFVAVSRKPCPPPPPCNCNCAPVIKLTCSSPPPPPSCKPPTITSTTPNPTITTTTKGSTLLSSTSSSSSSTVGTPTTIEEWTEWTLWTDEGPTTLATKEPTTSTTEESTSDEQLTTSSTKESTSDEPFTRDKPLTTSTTEEWTVSTTEKPTTSTTEESTTLSSTRTSGSSTSTVSTTLTTPFNNNSCQYVLSSDSGWFSSPNHPKNYPDSASCTWLINVTRPIVLSFTQFLLDPNYDYVRVHDGPTEGSFSILNATGTLIPQSVISSTGQVFVKFTSDISENFSGFNASYSLYVEPTTTPRYTGTWITSYSSYPTGPYTGNCQTILEGDSGYFTSPSYPGDYPNNANCSWMITVSKGNRIYLSFNEIRTEYEVDYLKVYDGPAVSWSYQLFVASGDYGSRYVVSSSNQVLVTLTSDVGVTARGFSANYSLYVPPTSPPIYECGANITANSGSFASPKFPNGYPNNSRCTWTITSDPGSRILFRLTDFSTHPNDVVSVWDRFIDSPYNSNRRIYLSGNATSPCTFLSSSNTIIVTFWSSFNSVPYAGFRANFTTDHGCNSNYISSGQEIRVLETPGYRINSSVNYRACTWRIRVDDGFRVNLTLADFVGWHQERYYSRSISVYEGNNTDFQLAYTDTMSSSLAPFYVISKSNEMTVVTENFESNSRCETYNNKLRFTYTQTASSDYGCYGSMNTNSRTVTSPGYPKQYTPRSLNCQWIISEPSGSKLNISFPNGIDTYSENLILYDVPYTAKPHIFSVSGTIYPKPFLTSFNVTRIRFGTSSYINNASLYSGWKLTWNPEN